MNPKERQYFQPCIIFYALQEEARRQASHESEAKIENAQLKSEFVAASDKIQQLQRDIQRVESDKRDGVGRIEAMQAELERLKAVLESERAAHEAAVVERQRPRAHRQAGGIQRAGCPRIIRRVPLPLRGCWQRAAPSGAAAPHLAHRRQSTVPN